MAKAAVGPPAAVGLTPSGGFESLPSPPTFVAHSPLNSGSDLPSVRSALHENT